MQLRATFSIFSFRGISLFQKCFYLFIYKQSNVVCLVLVKSRKVPCEQESVLTVDFYSSCFKRAVRLVPHSLKVIVLLDLKQNKEMVSAPSFEV